FNCLGAPNMPIVEISRRASLQAGDVMLLCSDGLWGVLPDHVLAQQLQNHTIVRAVPELISTATGIGGKNGDNVTALAMMWESGSSLPDSHTITTNVLPVGSVTTTIQSPRHADLEQSDSFDETDIEKAIEEIRGAIEKSSRLTSRN
ncbi:MAG: serine/threonine-protein phosphatase, partial [Pseudomonadota bacterium]|nr:serine/threonine-protein phosphatase [Pseudomonadota bacterium]